MEVNDFYKNSESRILCESLRLSAFLILCEPVSRKWSPFPVSPSPSRKLVSKLKLKLLNKFLKPKKPVLVLWPRFFAKLLVKVCAVLPPRSSVSVVKVLKRKPPPNKLLYKLLYLFYKRKSPKLRWLVVCHVWLLSKVPRSFVTSWQWVASPLYQWCMWLTSPVIKNKIRVI